MSTASPEDSRVSALELQMMTVKGDIKDLKSTSNATFHNMQVIMDHFKLTKKSPMVAEEDTTMEETLGISNKRTHQDD